MNNRYCFLLLTIFTLFASRYLFADSGIERLAKALKTAKDDTNKVNTMNRLARELITIGNYPQADSLAQDEFELAERLDFKKGIANAYNSLGVACNYQGDYSHSINYLLKSLKLYEEMNDKVGQAIALQYMGTAYTKQGDSADAIKDLHEALHIFTEQKDTDYTATALLSVGNLYETEGDHTTALAHMARALQLFKIINERDGIASAMMYMGDVYNNESDYAQAIDYYTRALNIFTGLKDKAGVATTLVNFGKVYRKQGDFKKALDYQNKAVELAKAIGAIGEIEEAEMELSSLYEQQDKGELALEHYKTYTAIKDTIFNQQNSQRALREEMNLEFEKKQATEKAEYEKKEAIHREEVRKKEVTIYYISGILILVIGFAGFAYRSNMQKQRAKNIIEEKNYQITESISYAEKIQRAVLPAKEEIQGVFPESFVLYMPKDIVSGDFYFFRKNQERTFLAVGDCTGHGVPGAFMSMVCSEKLNDLVKSVQGTGEILKKLNQGLKASLHQTDSEGSQQDGMDIALCAITPAVNGIKISFSGANRPLWVIPKGKNEVHELLPTKKSVGTFTTVEEDYSTYIVQLHKGDTFYMFTDGYTDQFGGEDGKKISAKKFGELLLSIQDKSMPEQEKELQNFLQNWKKDMAQQDDILVMGVRV